MSSATNVPIATSPQLPTDGTGVGVGVGAGVGVANAVAAGVAVWVAVGVGVGADGAVATVHATLDAAAGVAVGSDRDGIIRSTRWLACPTWKPSEATGEPSTPTLCTYA